jgi:hypothetical protein
MDAVGILKSHAMPGLWLDVSALLNGRMLDVLNVLQTGLDSPEHHIFTQKLTGQNYHKKHNLILRKLVKFLDCSELKMQYLPIQKLIFFLI